MTIAALTCASLVPIGAASAAEPPTITGTTGGIGATASTVDGVLRLAVADDFRTHTSTTTAFVQTDAGDVAVPSSLVDSLSSGDAVTVERNAAGTVLAVESAAALGASADAASTDAISGVGTHNVWYVRVNWTGAAAPTTSVDGLVSSLASYYATISPSSTGARIKVAAKGSLGSVTIPVPPTSAESCGASQIYTDTAAALGGAMPAVSRFNHLVLILPDLPAATPGCTWAGLGSIGASSDGRSRIWLNGASALTPRVLDHEFGHNLGLQHSDSVVDSSACVLTSAKQTLGSACYDEYGDPWDVMGGGFATPDENTVGFMSAPNLDRIGLLSSTEKYTVASATPPTIALAPVARASGRRLVSIPYGTRTYTVEYRYGVPGSLDAWLPEAGYGVVVRLREQSIDHDLVVDFLKNGETFSVGGLSISATGLTATAANVKITRTADKTAPTVGTVGYWNSEKTYEHIGTVLTSGTLAVGYTSAGDADSGLASVKLYVDGKLRATSTNRGQTKLQATGLSQGRHSWYFLLRDTFNNTRKTATRSFRIDTGGKPKITKSPRASLAKGTVSTKTIPATVGWSASDGCGIVWNSVAGSNGLEKTYYGAPKAIATRVKVGYTQFAVRSADCLGNVTADSYGPVSKGVLDKQSKRTGYHGTWSAAKATKALGGTEQVTTKKKAYVTYKVKARSFGWVATKGTGRGKAAVYVDGTKVAVVNLAATKTVYAQQVFTKTWSKVGTHTIKIVNLSSKKIGVDAFTRLS
ncbi:metallopeptidase domain-containing protein [Cellulomonas edaphi]|uniref:Peptidase M11 gametolysin domain-containing protein n=1 Tax=Cellulomonas edaphi TaxID=3053468 RepID=A0ABT7S2G0_9CELL|nr:hypothetical protein [Cellulomons edaphi]MDM7829814.1 hypothetical protein [Cellulomons edaphi]